jgi:hypothetical protein
MNPDPPISPADQDRIAFLTKLDNAPFEVTEWEARFIESFLTNPRPLTPAQREAADTLKQRYLL